MFRKIKVILVEDVKEVREGLERVLNASEEITCVQSFSNAEEAVERIPDILPDVVMLDINLPGISGLEALNILKERCHNTQFIMLTIYDDDEHVFKALQIGATGYLLKKAKPDEIKNAIKDVYKGGSPMSSQIARRVVQTFQKSQQAKKEYDTLSAREKEVLQFLAKGYRYKEIAGRLFISVDTVRTHIRNIYKKLQVGSRTEALNKTGTIIL